MMIVAALLAVVLGGFGSVSAQARSFDFDQRRFTGRLLFSPEDGEQGQLVLARHADHSRSDRFAGETPSNGSPGRLISPWEAARQAQERYGGRVLSVELVRAGTPYYRVKLLRNGNVRVVRIPAGQ
jgi:hypothetical protein